MIKIPYQFVPYLLLSLLLAAVMLALMLYTWKRRAVWGAPFFFYTLILATIWIAAQALEIAALELPTKIFWANIQYTPIMLMPATYFYLALQFTGREDWIRLRWLRALLLLVPVIFNMLIWSNDLHGLIRQNIYLDLQGAFPMVGKTFGPLFWPFAGYNYSLTVFTLILLALELREKTPLYREQVLSVFFGLLLPVCTTVLQVSGLNPVNVDLTPPFLGVSALIISWGIFRYYLFDVVPIAHSAIIKGMSAGMVILDNNSRVLDINPAAQKMLSILSQQAVGLKIETLLSEFPDLVQELKDKKSGIHEIIGAYNGVKHYYEVSLNQLIDADCKPLGWIIQIYDITKRKAEEEKIRHMASHDALTGLPNRNYFQKLFAEELSHAKLCAAPLAVAYLDLDDFKIINDTYGHEAGDIVLREVAKMFRRALRDTDIIARVGGDEFAILFPSLGENEKLDIVGRKMLRALEKRINLKDASVRVQASIGFSVFPRHGEDMESLLVKADRAMYGVKAGTKNCYAIYDAPEQQLLS